MIKKHSIALPQAELIQQWFQEVSSAPVHVSSTDEYIATRAAQWGADQELEAIEKEILDQAWFANPEHRLAQLRAARRPKPPSLKEQALEQLNGIATLFKVSFGGNLVCDTIRRALESLPDD